MARRVWTRFTIPRAFLTILAIPLQSGEGWRDLPYSHIPANHAVFSETGLKIEVRSSSSPLFYTFAPKRQVHSLSIKGSASALPKIPEGEAEGIGKGDDFALRIGLILEGNNGISWFEKLFAPQWLRQLIDIAPEGTRFGRVSFLTLAQTKAVGDRRPHPRMKYVDEEVAAKLEKPGPFEWDHNYAEPQSALGLWVHADGDDTQSSFDVEIKSLGVGVTEEKELGRGP